MEAKVKETLEKQLELLFERSAECNLASDLFALSSAMKCIADCLLSVSKCDSFFNSCPADLIRETVRSTIDDTQKDTFS